MTFNPALPGQGPTVTPEQWAQYIEWQSKALEASSGFERLQLQANIDNAMKGYQNALKIARLQADTSRYGYDTQRQTAMAQLQENARQFEANHALDLKKFGLSEGELMGVYNGQPTLAARGQQLQEAQLIAQQRSQPNRLFQTMDLEQALGSIRAGTPAVSLARSGVPSAGGLGSDYTGNPYLAGYLETPPPGAPTNAGGATGPVPQPSSGRTGTDPRQKALRAVMDALPPSATEGLDPTGVAALNAAFHIYSAPQTLKPGTLESLGPTQRAAFESAGTRLQGYTGRSPEDLYAEYTRNGIGQGSVRSAY